jgi:predicted N-acetyltransferase YhbS
MTDFVYATYLSDLAVRESYQKRGIGRELIRLTQEAGGPKTTVILLSAPAAVNYYPRIGFTRHDSAWIIKGGEPLR